MVIHVGRSYRYRKDSPLPHVEQNKGGVMVSIPTEISTVMQTFSKTLCIVMRERIILNILKSELIFNVKDLVVNQEKTTIRQENETTSGRKCFKHGNKLFLCNYECVLNETIHLHL